MAFSGGPTSHFLSDTHLAHKLMNKANFLVPTKINFLANQKAEANSINQNKFEKKGNNFLENYIFVVQCFIYQNYEKKPNAF